ncbi:MAG: hypothetical protein HQL56_11920 [Magnetococcales bacterium]|nr:hypothetical protein [Magnetococcales bacterium]
MVVKDADRFSLSIMLSCHGLLDLTLCFASGCRKAVAWLPIGKPTNANSDVTGSNWTDPDDAPDLTEEWFAKSDLCEGNRLIRTGPSIVDLLEIPDRGARDLGFPCLRIRQDGEGSMSFPGLPVL